MMLSHLCHSGSSIRTSYLRELYNKQKGRCYYTGVEMALLSEKKMDPFLMSIDRQDSSKGYIEGNIVLCCLGINYLKNTGAPSLMYKALEVFYKGAKHEGHIRDSSQ